MSAPVGAAPTMHPVRQGVEGFFTAGKAILNSTDGLSRVSELCLAIFAAIAHFAKSIPDAFVRLGDAMNTFLDLTSIVSIIKRCKDWFVADADGKMMWHKAWHQICSTVCLTAAHVISFVKFLATTLKVFSLGRLLAPLTYAFQGFMGGFGIFELISNSIKCHKANFGLPRAEKNKLAWEHHAEGMQVKEWQTLILKKIEACEERLRTYKQSDPKHASAIRLLQELDSAYECTDSEEIKAFCKDKVKQLQVVVDNHKVDRTKSIVLIIYAVALTVLMAISLVLAFYNPLALIVTGLIASILYSGVDVTEFMVDTFLNKTEVPKVAAKV